MADTNYTHALPAEIVQPEDPLLVSGRVAVAAFLAGYSSGTRVSYTTDLRIFAKPRVHGHRRMAVSLAIGTDAGDARRKAADVADALTITVR